MVINNHLRPGLVCLQNMGATVSSLITSVANAIVEQENKRLNRELARLQQNQNNYLNNYDEGKSKILEMVEIGEECSICLEQFSKDQDAAVTKCKHIYHRTCLQKWMDSHDSCPTCRHNVVRWFKYVAPIE